MNFAVPEDSLPDPISEDEICLDWMQAAACTIYRCGHEDLLLTVCLRLREVNAAFSTPELSVVSTEKGTNYVTNPRIPLRSHYRAEAEYVQRSQSAHLVVRLHARKLEQLEVRATPPSFHQSEGQKLVSV